ncbi:hypothetical protein P153DRAFT_365867 [Dothidotthia symphoricarpi CBS 119687]|uniref:Uncharacterized protein n=1 Tax=Dothidotthia symphoricarpi CBS 119687 TaxID=1392245 RepID=A0A6A6AEE0_9PLEO|nr:uncharacterized protein P153DRAFT_365867 [Dothidotthia symphoricarpi CBS 119687]KAF2130239.1 hypothetical protein P153DRAFT_365867 [Dothidotthia symphoricarpi CBS 119687]
MTRVVVYAVSLVFTIACTVMTIASIAMPRWVSYSPNGEREYSYGLHSRCSAVTGTCVPFPRDSDCAKDASFCNMWRTVGFLTSFGVVVELCTLVSFVVIMAGGVQRRVQGWGIVASVLLFSAFVQCAGMAIVAFLFDNDSRFWSGWHLDASWSLCTASWILLVLTSLGIAASSIYLPYEGDYEFIPDQSQLEPDDRLLSRIAAWDNGYKGDAHEYSYQRDQDAQSITSFVSEQSRR